MYVPLGRDSNFGLVDARRCVLAFTDELSFGHPCTILSSSGAGPCCVNIISAFEQVLAPVQCP